MFNIIKSIKKWNRERLSKRRALQKIARDIRWLSQAFLDRGLSTLKLRFNVLGCPEKYEGLLLQTRPGDLVIDGGANLGLFSDMMLSMGAKVHAFEPNPVLTYHLKHKYRNEKNIVMYEQAISDKHEKLTFSMNQGSSFIDQSQGGTLKNNSKVLENHEIYTYSVESIDFIHFIEDLLRLENKEKIDLIKLDIEGAEFDVLNAIIDSGSYLKIGHLLCETHERFFTDGKEKLSAIQKKMSEKNIENIYLDWV